MVLVQMLRLKMILKDSFYTTKPFMSGRSQAIRIPKELRIEDTEVVINRIGDSLIITPKKALKHMFQGFPCYLRYFA